MPPHPAVPDSKDSSALDLGIRSFVTGRGKELHDNAAAVAVARSPIPTASHAVRVGGETVGDHWIGRGTTESLGDRLSAHLRCTR